MKDWCDKVDIKFTPTLYLNGFFISETYSTENLAFILLKNRGTMIAA
jgi:hypothetical protein